MKVKANITQISKELHIGVVTLKNLILSNKIEFMEMEEYINSLGNKRHRYYIDLIAYKKYLKDLKEVNQVE